MKSALPASEVSLLVLLGLLWGTPYALTKIALTTIPPLTLVAGRVTLAAVVLWIVVSATRCKVPLRRGTLARMFAQGMLSCFIPYTLITFGQQSVDSALAAILNSTTPLFVFLMGRAGIGSDEIDGGSPFGVMLGLAGVVMIAGADAFVGLGKGGAGQVSILLATASSACSVIYARRLSDVPAVTVAAGALSSAAVLLVPLCFLVESPLRCEPSARSLAALAANGVAATALGFVVYFRIIRTVGGAAASSVGYLKPAFGVLLGCLMTGEHFTWIIAVGLVSICLGVAAINFARFKKPKQTRDISGSPGRTVTVT